MYYIAFVFCLGFAFSAFGQSPNQQRTYQPPAFADADRLARVQPLLPAIDQYYREYAAQKHIPGLSYGIVLDGKLIHSGALGYTDVAKKTPATPQSVFRIASMTKSITALAVLTLRDAGRLNLDDPVSRYVPELKNITYLTTDAPPLTIRHLLSHAGGLPEDNPWGDRQLADSEADLSALWRGGVSFANVPGVAFEYSNLGFATLGRIITVVSGKPYQQYITETILRPLGMTHTEWEYSRVPAAQLAHGYRWSDEQWVEEPLLHDGSHGAMGGLLTSIDDFGRYVAFQLSAWPPRNEPETGGAWPVAVRRASVREMQLPKMFSSMLPNFRFPGGRATPLVGFYAYGLGWSRDGDGREYVGHGGGLPGFGSYWRMMPDYGLAVVAFSNLTYANLSTPAWAVLDTLLTNAKLTPRRLPVSPVLNERKTQLVNLLPDWTNAEGSKMFAENFFPDQSLANRRKQTQALFAKLGRITSVGELEPENQLRGRFRLTGEHGAADVFFTLTPEIPALIQQLDITEVTPKP